VCFGHPARTAASMFTSTVRPVEEKEAQHVQRETEQVKRGPRGHVCPPVRGVVVLGPWKLGVQRSARCFQKRGAPNQNASR